MRQSAWYWRALPRIGGDVPPSSLMHGQLSPDGSRVCFVRDNNLFVHNLQDQSITQLTKDGSDTCLNGVFDWAYEEEFELNSGIRWSPDSQRIAYWQLDSSGVREFNIVDNTVGSYAKVISIRYPKVGEKNSSARVGVVGMPEKLKGPLPGRIAELEIRRDHENAVGRGRCPLGRFGRLRRPQAGDERNEDQRKGQRPHLDLKVRTKV